ncbi:hypothetical protein RHSIM_Rhsim06G0238300 [Rhododendron simsii]|uniref:Biogenesis of lysosome-related organelles complex 1 subunit 7 n=1 Tax=Rhododendron simsii TaxID=118357 RepID=A0A834GTJ4_RHOSS|nr:hypothetical protein RHSIM_Rhsim06G0238300 [Rhododendron simsii]
MSDGTQEDRHSDSSDGPSVLVLTSPEPPTVAAESDADASTTACDAPRPDATTAPADDDDAVSGSNSSSVVARGLSSMISSVIRDFDARAEETGRSQDQLSFAIDRLTRELDQLLEDAPVPFIMQHAVKISLVRKRVSSLNTLLKSIQRRLDNVDRMLSVGLLQDKGATENVRPN